MLALNSPRVLLSMVRPTDLASLCASYQYNKVDPSEHCYTGTVALVVLLLAGFVAAGQQVAYVYCHDAHLSFMEMDTSLQCTSTETCVS